MKFVEITPGLWVRANCVQAIEVAQVLKDARYNALVRTDGVRLTMVGGATFEFKDTPERVARLLEAAYALTPDE